MPLTRSRSSPDLMAHAEVAVTFPVVLVGLATVEAVTAAVVA